MYRIYNMLKMLYINEFLTDFLLFSFFSGIPSISSIGSK